MTDNHGAEDADASPKAYDQDDLHTSSGLWYFNTASNSHVTGNRSYYVDFTEDTTGMGSIRGVTPSIASRTAGIGAVNLVTDVDGEQTMMYVDVFYIPGVEYGLISPGLAFQQGFEFAFDQAIRNFTISIKGKSVVGVTPQDATWACRVTHPPQRGVVIPRASFV